VRTPCNLGGWRAWFICPAVGCGRRVAILYGGGIFACRHCYRLADASSREDAGGRATRRADRLRARLGWHPGILGPALEALRSEAGLSLTFIGTTRGREPSPVVVSFPPILSAVTVSLSSRQSGTLRRRERRSAAQHLRPARTPPAASC
jgi:hypothetical protein